MAFRLFGKKRAAEPVEPQKRHRIGLALGGGGVKGAAHCGVLQALHEFGLTPEILSGTSAGSLVGALYAAGMTPVEICNIFINKEAKELLDMQFPSYGFFGHTPLLEFMRECLPVGSFEELKVPLKVTATDLDAGKTIIFESGELAPRLMASCCIPVVFEPIVIEGTNYVDGGVFMNLPAMPLRPECELLIGVSVHASVTPDYKKNLIGVAMRSFYLMFISNTIDDARMCDIHIDVNTTEYSSYDLGNIELLFERGYRAAVEVLESRGYERIMEAETISFSPRTEHRHTSPASKLKSRHDEMMAVASEQLSKIKSNISEKAAQLKNAASKSAASEPMPEIGTGSESAPEVVSETEPAPEGEVAESTAKAEA